MGPLGKMSSGDGWVAEVQGTGSPTSPLTAGGASADGWVILGQASAAAGVIVVLLSAVVTAGGPGIARGMD